ncbi:polysaccharide biosynthesis tyrosine autokinase [Xanthomarina sp. F1114]|uniref:GumC family protein n=1 Tax=Xanthomarina sp. F1114 TaxID=2996019 RepID=UPI00225E3F8F|nr:tyrosine-protein kinase domain-containing protein [Xanthomarina sp. F1114]MCX7548881.1 polysaccharide biosynthesis tyrosine autokinase [Xanthomarina sp. F1114]
MKQEHLNNELLQPDEEPIDIKQEIRRYLRYWPWFLLSVFITMSVAYIYLRYAPRIYQTSTKIKVLDESDGLELPTSAFIFKRSNINLENEMEILTSYRIVEQVVRELKLNTRFQEEGQILNAQLVELPFQFDQHIQVDSITSSDQYEIFVNQADFEIRNIKTEEEYVFKGHDSYTKIHNLPFDIKLNNSSDVAILKGRKFIVNLVPLKAATLQLKSRVKTEPIGKVSDLLELVINSESTVWSERVLNTLVSVFNEDGINDRQKVSKNTIDFIDKRFVFLAEELDSIEINKKEFKQDNNLVFLPNDAELGLEKRTRSEEELFKIENQVALAELVKESLNADKDDFGLIPANVGIENGGVNELINQYNTTVLEYQKYESSGGVNNPMVQQLIGTLSGLKRNINRSLETYSQQLELSRKQLDARNSVFRGEVSRIPEKEKLLRAIDRQQKIKESLYLLLLQKREEAAINLAITEPSIKVVEYALSGAYPISPKPKIVYPAALLGGLLIPFGLFYLFFLLDTKVHDKKDIEKVAKNISIIGQIPEVKGKDNLIFENPNDRSVLAESFRILSANVKYVLPIKEDKQKGHVIFCTSTIKGEGKTYVSVNLSLALSSLNKKVLLIGADLRNPQIHRYSNRDKNSKGLSNYLHDTSLDWKDILITGFKNHSTHDVLLSGAIPPNPAHLLTNGRFDTLIEEAREYYDYIVVDTSPTILVTDTMLISHLSDINVYIVKANYTEKSLLEFSKDLSESGKLKNMAYVVNSVGVSKHRGYGYNYGYGYGYNEDR